MKELGEPNFDNKEDVLDADELKLLEQESDGIAKFFDTVKNAEERRVAVITKMKPFFEAGLIDEDVITPSIEELCAIEGRDAFIKKGLEVMSYYYLARKKDKTGSFESIRREQQGRERINEILEYEFSDGGKSIKIHTWPKKKPGIRKLKLLILSGFNNLAEIINKNPDVEKVEAWSWIVYDHPDLIESLGFVLGEEYETTNEDHPKGRGSEMSRNDFLKKYLK